MADAQQPDALTVGVLGTVIGAAITGLSGFLLGWKKQNHAEKTDEVQRLIAQLDKAEAHMEDCNEKHRLASVEIAQIKGTICLLQASITDCHDERDELKQRICALEAK